MGTRSRQKEDSGKARDGTPEVNSSVPPIANVSDILIEIFRGKDLHILSRWTELGQSDRPILYSPVTAAELWAGARSREHEAITGLFQTLVCTPIDGETGRQAGDYLRQYGKSHGLELGDALIASAAFLNRAELWTRNRKHYPMKELSFY